MLVEGPLNNLRKNEMHLSKPVKMRKGQVRIGERKEERERGREREGERERERNNINLNYKNIEYVRRIIFVFILDIYSTSCV